MERRSSSRARPPSSRLSSKRSGLVRSAYTKRHALGHGPSPPRTTPPLTLRLSPTDRTPRSRKCCPPSRARQPSLLLPIQAQHRPSQLAAALAPAPLPRVPPRDHQLPRLPPRLLLSRLGLRRPDNQDLGLGAGRAGTDHQGPHQGRAGRRLWGAAREHASRVVQL